VLFGVEESVDTSGGQSLDALVVFGQEELGVFQNRERRDIRSLVSVSDDAELIRGDSGAGGEVSDGDLGVAEVEGVGGIESDDSDIERGLSLDELAGDEDSVVSSNWGSCGVISGHSVSSNSGINDGGKLSGQVDVEGSNFNGEISSSSWEVVEHIGCGDH